MSSSAMSCRTSSVATPIRSIVRFIGRSSSLPGASCEGSAAGRRRQRAGVPFSDDYRVEIIGRAWATARRSRRVGGSRAVANAPWPRPLGRMSRGVSGPGVKQQLVTTGTPVRHSDCPAHGIAIGPRPFFELNTELPQMNEWVVRDGHCGLLYEDGVLADVLTPGKHRRGAWRDRTRRDVTYVDLRERSVTIKNQEILTADKVAVRVSLLVYMRVVDAKAAHQNVVDFQEHVYEDVQLAARRFLATRTL